jgi:signal transduction histidine kinase
MNRLLEHLRSDAMQAPEKGSIELCDVLNDVIGTMSGGTPVPSLDCQVKALQINANRDRLGAIIGHLIRNAQDATPDDGQIIVRLFKGANHAIVEVQDNGCGMDREFIRDRLFRPFDSTKGTSGMGIGVYEARDYVHKLGGDVEVLSRPGEGTTFRLRLPISDVLNS